jgi:hypothetical protein
MSITKNTMLVRSHSAARAWRIAARRTALAVVGFALASFAAGCASFAINTPSGFGQLRDQRAQHYDYRAVSAYGVALAVRVVPNAERGNLEFWSEVVDRHLQHGGVYHPAGSVDVRTSTGLQGRRLAYAFGDPQSGQTYWVTVFVTPRKVYLVEAGGGVDAFTRARDNVERSIQSFRPI